MKVRLVFIALWVVAFFMFDSTATKQRQWQRMKKLKSTIIAEPNSLPGYWLSTDPNYFCADLNCDNKINFLDYATYLRLKGG